MDILPLLDLENENNNGLIIGRTRIINNNQMMLLESGMDIDGSLAKPVLIVVRFEGTNAE